MSGAQFSGTLTGLVEAAVAIGQVLAGKYRVEQILGSGGMGVVVAAWHLELDQRVALKFLHPSAGELSEPAERFRREARALAKIRSEHAARVLDIGTLESGMPYLVMEFLQGNDLAEELRRRGPLPIEETVDYILQAIEAIAEAHAAGIVHRDLKPANLFLARRPDGSPCVKVLDFGISKSLMGTSVSEVALTRTSTMMGSPLYMSPEQMRSSRDVDQRTDIWSLGAIVYEMLTGRTPYLGQTIPELCSSLFSDAPLPLEQVRADIPPRLSAVVLQCLAKDRTQRYETVGDLALALAEFAPASCKLHVDRARRVLGVSDVGAGVSASGQRRAIEQVSPHGATLRSSDPALVSTPEPTVSSWGATGGNRELTSERRAKTKVWLIAAASFVTVVGVGTAVFLSSGSAEPAAPAASGPSRTAPEPTPPTVVPVPTEPLTVTPQSEPEPSSTIVTPAPAPSASHTGPSASAKQVAPPARATKPLTLPASPSQQPISAPASASAKQQKPGIPISEFGGRR